MENSSHDFDTGKWGYSLANVSGTSTAKNVVMAWTMPMVGASRTVTVITR